MKSPPKNSPAVAQVTYPPSENYLGTWGYQPRDSAAAEVLNTREMLKCSPPGHMCAFLGVWFLLLMVMAGTVDRTRALCVPGKHSITELHPQPICIHFKTCSDCSVASDITY